MDYRRLDYESLRTLCTQVFHGYGFSEDEAARAKSAGLLLAGLGKRILRCETAPLFVLSCLAFRYEL